MAGSVASAASQRAVERAAAVGHAVGVALGDAAEPVELRDEAAQVLQLGHLLDEDRIDAGRRRLGAQRAQALGEEPRVRRLALGDDQVAGGEPRVGLVLGPRGVEGGAPGFERAEDVEALDDLGLLGSVHFHPGPPRGRRARGARSLHRCAMVATARLVQRFELSQCPATASGVLL